MSRYSPFKLHLGAMLVLVFTVSACGGGSESQIDGPSVDSISAKPAFLDRGCTPGQAGPQRFCPHGQS